MDLARLIQTRMRATGDTYRTAEQRAHAAGHPISRSAINAYARGTRNTHPDPDTIAALTAALQLPYDEVAAAVHESFGVDVDGSGDYVRDIQRANAWLRLTAGRTEAEIAHLLEVVAAVLQIRDEFTPVIPEPRPGDTPVSGNDNYSVGDHPGV